MMNQEELNALISLLQRTPLTPAESLWASGIISRLQEHITRTQKEVKKDEATE